MRQPDLSVIIVAKNEAHDIADTITSVREWCREVIVFDSGSTDGTQELCRRLGAKVFETDWPGDGPQKNRALAEASGEWVLCLDADERIGPELREEILRELPRTRHAALSTPRLSSFCGQDMRHGDWWPDRIVRIFRRDRGRFTDVRTHTRPIVDGTTGALSCPILHRSIPDLHEALDKLNVYSTEGAKTLYERGKRASFLRAVASGTWAFVRMYVLQRGFLDGRRGFVVALLNAEGTFYRYLKLWLMRDPIAGHALAPRPPEERAAPAIRADGRSP
jgi:glycosyltransferase involved in cell wall biosynthesis